MDQDLNENQRILPLIPLRDVVVFPHMVIPLFVGREKSIAALEEAMAAGRDILLATQKEASTVDPTPEDIYDTATVGSIIQLLKLPDGTVKVLVEGRTRANIQQFLSQERYLLAKAELMAEPTEVNLEEQALMRTVMEAFAEYIKLNQKLPSDLIDTVREITAPGQLSDTIAAHLSVKTANKQELLETLDVTERLHLVYDMIKAEVAVLEIERRIKRRVKKQMEKTQKEYYLNEQMKAIQKELGETDEQQNEIQDLLARIDEKAMPDEIKEKTRREVQKLKMMSPMSAEATVVRNYVDWIVDLPWNEVTDKEVGLAEAEQILNDDHYGLKDAKERILEHLAVLKLVGTTKAPILCFVGPPGVGKTSIASSIARATGRNFVRLSLGGVRDEAQIRGHRRTYIGSMPGKILQSLKKAGSNNPVFLLDEIDKMSMDFRGDPSSALLEVLDPEQNDTFNDHYLDLDYNLSDVMFITTANYMPNIPEPLKDRMEIIEISGYTEHEKLNIAKRHLLAKQLEANGLGTDDLHFNDAGITELIRHYTREAGVRSLERAIAKICRKIAKTVVRKGRDKLKTIRVTPTLVQKEMGAAKYTYGMAEMESEVGYTTGLAWTQTGGELLGIEIVLLPGKGTLTITGKLGEVMMESARAAVSYVRSRAHRLGLAKEFYQKIDIHIHVPEGAIPKDGPSAGITMATALVSALTGIPVKKEVAMTGEITLRGKVLPIGGIKEKLLAAHRGGITTVLLPKENEKNLPDVELPRSILSAVNIIFVGHMDEVLTQGLKTDNPDTLLDTDPKAERSVDQILGFTGKTNVPTTKTTTSVEMQ